MDNWTRPSTSLELENHQVDIWRISLDLYPASAQWAESTLSADESARAKCFYFEKDRRRYTLTHACLRDILSHYLRCRHHELTFSIDQYRKPFLSNCDLQFNLSHSGDYILIAVAHKRKVGVDVEHFRINLELEKIAKRFFSPMEHEEFSTVPDEQKMTAFFNCWTRKEAYIKAHGLGMSMPLSSFDVSLAPNETTSLRATRPDAAEASKWTLLSLDVQPGYAGAIAVQGKYLEFRLWDWDRIIQ